jgi:alpha-1,6-mannosyltransferase
VLVTVGAVASSTTSRNVAVGGSILSVLFVATVASVPRSPYQPVLPASAGPWGPFRWLAEVTGLAGVHGEALVVVSMIAVAVAALAFLSILREAWRGTLSPGAVIGLAVAYHAILLLLPLLFSRDVYSYSYYGRIAGVYHANPYVATPSDYPGDTLAAYVGPRWVQTPAVYGPLFTLISSMLVRVFRSVTSLIVAFRVIAIVASLATMAIVSRLVRKVRPDREAFAVAILGLNPVVLFQSVASGHVDLLVALSIAAALALVFAGRELPATAVLALGTLMKATALIPLALVVAAAVARREPGRRARTLAAHVAVAGGIALLFVLPFIQTHDPSLGMLELAQHQGWLAPSRFFARVLSALAGGAVGVVARISFGVAALVAVFLVARALVRRGALVTPAAQGAAWGWSLLFFTLLGPVLLPWYLTWTLPVAWLLPSVPRLTLIFTGVALSLSQWTTESARFPHAYDANVLFGHYVLAPVVIGLLAWLLVDLVRRLRSGVPLEQEEREVATPAGRG